MGRRVRIEDVARAAGVGAMTVSRAINNPSAVSAEKRKLIDEAIARTGYVPNLMAGGLASRRSRIVGVLNPTMKTSVFSDMTQGLSDVLEPAGYQLLLGTTAYSMAREEELIRTFIGRQADALVLTGASHADAARRRLAQNGVSVVETFDLPADPIDMVVGFSAFDAAAAMAGRMAAWGYKRPAVIAAPQTTDNRTQRRIDGFRHGLEAAGLKLGKRRVHEAGALTINAGAAAIETLLDGRADIDAVLCTNDVLAVGALLACQRRGWDAPGRVAVSGFGDIEIAGALSPGLTTVRIPGYDMGRRIGELLAERLSGAATDRRIVDMGFEIVRRESA